jgi:hypothetical protein
MDEQRPGTDLVRQATEEVSEEVGRFMGTIFGSASMEADRLIGDRVGWWRWRQSLRLAKKAQALLDKEGLDAHQIPLRTSIPLMEQASGSLDVPPSFANVLAEIEPTAAKLLEDYYVTHMRLAPSIRNEFGVFLGESEREQLGLSRDEFEYHTDNLIRLGLLRLVGTPPLGRYYDSLNLTAFARSFVRACLPPGTPDPEIEWVDAAAVRAHIAERDAATVVESSPETS